MPKVSEHSVGIYRSHHPLKNFKIRINLKKMVPLTLLADQQNFEVKDELELTELNKSNYYQEERIFVWQKKVFSRREVECYSKRENCKDFVAKRYNEEITSDEDQIKPTRLFNYVNMDIASGKFIPTDESPTTTPTHPLEDNFSSLKLQYSTKTTKKFIPKVNIINKPAKAYNRSMDGKQTHKMYIMADLNPFESDDSRLSEENEIVLCSVAVDENGVITVSPDFCKRNQFYEAHNNKHESFQYLIEHSSSSIPLEEISREKTLLTKVYSRHTELVSACLDSKFDLPPAQTYKVYLLGEIVSAKDFELDNLYVHYFFELPENWEINEEQQLAGITQTCATTTAGRDTVAYFSYPFEAEFNYKVTNVTGKEMMPNWPQLFLEVISLDRWNRYSTEGYTYISLPSEPGTYNLQLSTWRPISQTPVGNLRRFFIGGTPELEDLTSVGIPSTFEGKKFSKLGVKTQTSGDVVIKLNIIHQSEIFAMEHKELKKTKTLLSHLDATSVQNSISAVLSAFQRARTRMLAARSGLENLQ